MLGVLIPPLKTSKCKIFFIIIGNNNIRDIKLPTYRKIGDKITANTPLTPDTPRASPVNATGKDLKSSLKDFIFILSLSLIHI